MTPDKKMAALKYCLKQKAYEDAAGHLCDLLEFCRLQIKPSVGRPYRSLTAMVRYYGQNLIAVELPERL